MYFRYLARELRRRARSASVVAIGLALGVGLVITVTAAASGVKTAQGQVLQSLYGVGTDITVTKTATPGSGGAFHFGTTPPSRSQAGQGFSRDRLTSTGGLTTIDSSDVTAIGRLQGVVAATGALTLNSIHITGTFGGGSGGAAADPSSAPFSVSTFTVYGIDADDPGLGPLSASNLAGGVSVARDWFAKVEKGGSSSDQLLALVSSSYAKQNKLKAGSTLTISGSNFKVLGVISLTAGADAADVYIPLSEAQKLAGLTAKVNTIYVQATDSAAIPKVQSEIQHQMPKATVTTAADLASEVTGSLSTASSLAGSLGLWLAVAVLLAAFVLAALLTTFSVTRRVREFGTLKAMGWHSRRIVGQVLGESVLQGLVGGVLGIGLGVLGAFLVTRLAPTVQATVPPAGLGSGAGAFGRGAGGFGGGGFGGGGFGGGGTGSAARKSFAKTFAANNHTITLHLTAPLSIEVLGLAILLALAGGVIAGALGGWRAARLQPAEALRRVE